MVERAGNRRLDRTKIAALVKIPGCAGFGCFPGGRRARARDDEDRNVRAFVAQELDTRIAGCAGHLKVEQDELQLRRRCRHGRRRRERSGFDDGGIGNDAPHRKPQRLAKQWMVVCNQNRSAQARYPPP